LRKTLLLAITSLVPMFAFAAPWDFLKVIPQLAGDLNPIIEWLLLIASFSVLFISATALKRKRTQKLAFVTMAFGLFFLKSVLNLVDLYFSPGFFMNFAVQGAFDFLILVSLFIALFRK
jgi:hypothetical protein